MVKIVVAGIGGVGGFFGGKLARHFQNSKEIQIHFIARGEHKSKIQQQGLIVETDDEKFIAHPASITSYPADILHCDYLIICTKSYDLEKTIGQLKPIISDGTVILPLLNGVDSKERIGQLLPKANIWQGCVYIVSRLAEPGRIKQSGKLCSLYFGNSGKDERVYDLQQLFKAAAIDSTVSNDITLTLWEKFLFISPVASLTSYLNATVGEIVSNDEHKKLLAALVGELKHVGEAIGISFPAGMEKTTLKKIQSLPPESTSSMHDDLIKKKDIEVESLTGYVVRLGEKYGIPVPLYRKIYIHLKERQAVNTSGSLEKR